MKFGHNNSGFIVQIKVRDNVSFDVIREFEVNSKDKKEIRKLIVELQNLGINFSIRRKEAGGWFD
jgi:hypothetical protein